MVSDDNAFLLLRDSPIYISQYIVSARIKISTPPVFEPVTHCDPAVVQDTQTGRTHNRIKGRFFEVLIHPEASRKGTIILPGALGGGKMRE